MICSKCNDEIDEGIFVGLLFLDNEGDWVDNYYHINCHAEELQQNHDELVKKLGSVFNKISMINEMFWPLTKELTLHIEALKKLDEQGIIELDQRYNLYGWWTRIYLGET